MRAANVLVLIAIGACSGDGGANDAGPPEVLQMFVPSNDGVLRLAAGHHCDVDGVPAREGDGCPHAPRFPGSAGPVTQASVGGDGRIRLVLDQRLLRSTVTQYQCACYPDCATRGYTFADDQVPDASRCTSCADSTATSTQDETGRCVDADGDGTPDISLLQPGVLSVDCGTDTPIAEDAGSYDPDGSQYIPDATGVAGLGPAISFHAALQLDSLCTVELSPSITDVEGFSIHVGFALTFHTEHQPALH